MTLTIYQVDAFTSHLFGGNPAAVVVLDEFLPEVLMQNIALENNLAETAFIEKKNNRFTIRWFTPAAEVELCGHATLASAFVLKKFLDYSENEIEFNSLYSGTLKATYLSDGRIQLNFPTDNIKEIQVSQEVSQALGNTPKRLYQGNTDLLAIFNTEEDVKTLSPDFGLVKELGGRGIIVSAQGKSVDFVSRFFAPQVGINEDPVTGSAHTTLTPYWAQQFNKNKLSAMQISPRKGELACTLKDERVLISGHAVAYMVGEISI